MRLNEHIELNKAPQAATESLRCSAMEIAQKTTAGKESLKGWIKDWVSSEYFVLATAPLHKVGNPQPLQKRELIKTLSAGATETEPIVLDINKKRVASTRTGYHPKVVLIAGNLHHSIASIQGAKYVKAWIGEKALGKVTDYSKMEDLKYYDGIAAQAPDLMRVADYSAWPASQILHPEFQQFGAPGSELRNPAIMNNGQLLTLLADYLSDLRTGNFQIKSDMQMSIPKGCEIVAGKLKALGVRDPAMILTWAKKKGRV